MAYIAGKAINVFGQYFDDIDDNLVGTNQDDEIHGHGGDDHLWGNDGDDYMTGGAGDDWIMATDSNNAGDWGYDQVWGGEGNDHLDFSLTTHGVRLDGDGGNDEIIGGSANDVIYGGDGWDTLYGKDGVDIILGGSGNDFIYGGNGGDVLVGDEGSDWIFGQAGSDSIYGDAGNDNLAGGTGYDVLSGGAGNDKFWFWAGDGPDAIVDFNTVEDSINAAVAGNAYNYMEATIDGGYGDAWLWANEHIGGKGHSVFVTNGVDGYLFLNQDGDQYIDNQIVLQGLNHVNDFSFADIV